MTENKAVSGYNFGTFGGVFLPSILTIIGVVMFLKLGEVTGKIGVFGALMILGVAELVAICTALSVSSISTNTPVKSGGPYFLISRTLGPGFGVALGLTYFVSQTLSIPFYIIGFGNAVKGTFGLHSSLYIMFGALLVLAVLAIVNAKLAITSQKVIFMILMVSIVSLFIAGFCAHPSLATLNANWSQGVNENHDSVAILFAVFFPAVTGFLAGVNMSGDLENPRRSIPRGTLLAIFTGLVIYTVAILLFGAAWKNADLAQNYYGLLQGGLAFRFGWIFVFSGVVAATLSSALGTILGAPRILQALAADHILPLGIFAIGTRKNNDPWVAMLLSLAISVGVIFWAYAVGGDALENVATLVTMFTLCVYAVINLAAALESFAANPSFRPQFRFFHWSVGVFGFILSLVAAFYINFSLMFIALTITVILAVIAYKLNLSHNFTDARRGYYFQLLRRVISRLSEFAPDRRNWRPQLLVMTGNLPKHCAMLQFGTLLNGNYGIMSVGNVMEVDASQNGKELRGLREKELDNMRAISRDYNIPYFPSLATATAQNSDLVFDVFLQTHSIGPIVPNIVMCGWPGTEERAAEFCRHLNIIKSLRKNCLLLLNEPEEVPANPYGAIDIWWRGQVNGSLMLTLAYLLTCNRNWRGVPIRLIRIASEDKKAAAEADLRQIRDQARVSAETLVLTESEGDFAKLLHRESNKSSVVFLGFVPPSEVDSLEFYRAQNSLLEGMPPTFLVSSVGDCDLQS